MYQFIKYVRVWGYSMVSRVELLVYFQYRASTLEQFKEFGATVQYVNKKLGYTVLYIDKDNMKSFTNKIKNVKGFKKYEVSPTELVDIDL